MDIHKKLGIAQERLNKEHDIQYMIEMNRVTHLLHKTRLLTRQRRILSVFARHYVISAGDIAKLDKKEGVKKDPDVEKLLLIERMLADFDEESNEVDRRIFYEVTGKQLNEGEFASYLTSSESNSSEDTDG